MSEALEQLLGLLDVEQTGEGRFVGRSPAQHAFRRVFGGQLFAQMLIAAGKTIHDDRSVHSMHAYFLRPGDQRHPIEFEVFSGLDGRTFSNRRVVASQNGREICNLAASFAVSQEGPEFQGWQPDVKHPDELPAHPERVDQYGEVMRYVAGDGAVEFRFDEGVIDADSIEKGTWHVWCRLLGDPPHSQILNSALVAYMSDIFLLETTLRTDDADWLDDVDFATIDYSMWFHRSFRLDGWHLLSFGAATARAGRALAYGEVFREDLSAIASMTQEGVTRYKPGRAAELQEKIRTRTPPNGR